MTSERAELAGLVEHSNDAIYSRTPDGIITSWNSAATRIFGYTAREIIGRHSRCLVPPGHSDELARLQERLRKGEVIEHLETIRQHKSGRRIQVSLTLSPLRGADQKLAGFSTIARDITQQMEMRGVLARRERELEDLFQEASVGLLMLTRDGTILRANRAFLELVDRPQKQVIGAPLQTFHPEPEQVAQWLELLAGRQTLHNHPAELLSSRKQPKAVLIDANVFWEQGRFVHSRWFVRDISRRRQLERELLEISDRERRDFAQELHDGLGQQLGGLAYLSNVLRLKLSERSALEAADADRIFNLLRQAIEQTRRIARGLSPIPDTPDGLINALRDLAQQARELYDIPCRLQCHHPVAVTDPMIAGHLFRIAQEAVTNALRHARPRTIAIKLQHRRNQLTLAVLDDGLGIGPISPRRSGLGLRIMQHRASLIRGSLTVQPRSGGGTEVRCSVAHPLPAEPGIKTAT